ncbi:hypothetical protein [Myceligenerans pegani]|uniref:Uncharacterized protein n=1 Tax=Myceligenerans pegani TaxID=2776917 RepID=A0ABR9N3L4_9MICO|nr:hypothetical protein [Myceligenerans sp. TRM 65318]MBE1878254.1 hypothetical protein [Myceligenerans sp. TRM 65318]MBE3020525.1 hypothetical protein [Myceligenerans sp. TRM 65318]
MVTIDATSRPLGRHLLTAYRAFGIAVAVPALAYAALYGALLVADEFESGEGWGLLIAQVIGAFVALVAAFVLHVVVARRLRLGWVHALAVVPLALAGVLFAGTEWWPGTDLPVWTVVTALAAPAVVGLLTAPGLVRRARWLAAGAAVLLLGLTTVADQAVMDLLQRADVRAAECPETLLVPPPDSPWVPHDLDCAGGGAEISLLRGNDLDDEQILYLTPLGTPFYDGAPEVHGSYVTFEYPELLGMPEGEFVATLEPVTVAELTRRTSRLSWLLGRT